MADQGAAQRLRIHAAAVVTCRSRAANGALGPNAVGCDLRQPFTGAMSVDSTLPESLNERAQHLLRVLVQSYIRDGQPVGSRSAVARFGPVTELGDDPQCHGGSGGAGLCELAAHLRRPRAHRSRLPLLRRRAAARGAAAGRVGGARRPARAARRRRARDPRRWWPRPRSCCRRITHLAGRGDPAAGAGGHADADRVRRRCPKTACW